jgi:hypothetical protein
MSSQEPEDLDQTLYRHGLSLAVLFDLLIAKGVLTPEEIRQQAGELNARLWRDDNQPEFSAP